MTKAAYEQAAEQKIRAWQSAYEMLKLRAARADPNSLNGAREDLELLERHAHMLTCRLAELKGCKEDGWERLSDGLDWARQVADSTLQQVSRRLQHPLGQPIATPGFPNPPVTRPSVSLPRGTT